MGNFLSNELKRMAEISNDLGKSKKLDFPLVDEYGEFARKFSESIIGYGESPFFIEEVESTSDGMVLVGEILNGSVWTPTTIPLDDEMLDFSFKESTAVNTSAGVHYFGREPRRQWKWGITPGNSWAKKMFFEQGRVWWDGNGSQQIPPHILSPIFSPRYPSLREVTRNRSNFKIKSGLALANDLVVFKDAKQYLLCQKKEVVAKSNKLMGPYILDVSKPFLAPYLSEYVSIL